MAPPLPSYHVNTALAAPVAAWWFVLGREPALSRAELGAVLGVAPELMADAVARASVPLDPLVLIKRLGGAVKIGEEARAGLSEPDLIKTMVAELKSVPGKIKFGISYYGDAGGDTVRLIERWGNEIKNQLKAAGRGVRFVFKKEASLSSASVLHNNLVGRGREFLVVPTGPKKFSLALTRAIQPLAAWSARDYGRPARDDKSGMLPPKLALMMINLAVSPPPLSRWRSALAGRAGFAVPWATESKEFVILDPFCGSGTILTEALLLGSKNIIGADISAQAIANTQKNISWQLAHPSLAKEGAGGGLTVPQILQSDIRGLSQKLLPHSIDAIITEPALGPPLKGNEKLETVKKTVLELNHLYFQAFREFKKLLSPGGTVVFVFPRLLVKDEWVAVSPRVVPDIVKLGFKIDPLLPPKLHSESFVLYRRPGQRVGREVWRFRLTPQRVDNNA